MLRLIYSFGQIYKRIIFRNEITKLTSLENLFQKEIRNFLLERRYIKKNQSPDSLSKNWNKRSGKKLLELKDPTKFYSSWVGKLGAMNLVVNSKDQFKRPYIYRAFEKYVHKRFEGKILDYGCGTASLSLSLLKENFPKAKLILSDVDNLAREFVIEYSKNHKEFNISPVTLDLDAIEDNSLDIILCIDVLEHLKNPSEVFFLLNRKLKKRGILFLKAPWLGHPEHLPESPVNWKREGGRKTLLNQYQKLYSFNPLRSPSGVYLKK